MIIFNPVIAESNADSFLSQGQTTGYYKMMDLQQNTWLYSLFKKNRIFQELMLFDMKESFDVGTSILTESFGVGVLSYGIPVNNSDSFIEEAKNYFSIRFKESDDIYWVSDAENYPNKDSLLKAIKSSDANIIELDWKSIKEIVRSKEKT